MIARIAVSVGIGSLVTSGLLFVMQLMIATGQGALTYSQTFTVVDFVRVERNEVVETKQARPERPPEPERAPDVPSPQLSEGFDTQMSVSMAPPVIETNPAGSSVGFGVSDGDYLPIVKVSPVYPQRALARRLEGYVLLEFAVTRTGAVKDIVVVESTAQIFERPAIEAALKFRYKPRVIDGESVEVVGVRNRITFTMASSQA
jgi:protein TonB